ncbi:MAG TPA: bifunctional precorrin-2 dehydrogenase/sirohydrochlorin ferrochelatase [Acidimicrobiia bacterium]|nr:bifunctional precorrin-2 dehydrogenase/sirohydrochlorin ferrochelatase [Acidimicrobiia bacterium]
MSYVATMPFGYPISLELRNRRCVVIGGETPAELKVQGLLDGGATTVEVIAAGFTPALERLDAHGAVQLVRRPYRRGDLVGAFLAVAAVDDPVIHAEVAREADEHRVLLNAVDDPEHCHFATPSIVRRGDLVLSVSTGGKAPALAKQVRQELADRYGPEFSALVDLLGEARLRARRRQTLPVDQWGQRWRRALAEDLCVLVRGGRIDEARRILDHHLAPVNAAPDRHAIG